MQPKTYVWFICIKYKNIGLLGKLRKHSLISFDHFAVCLMILILGKMLLYISEKVSIFDPMKAAFDDFYITDVFFEIQQNTNSKYDDDIVIIDMTSLRTRDEIAQVITDIKNCNPKILGIDLIFERPNFNELDDVALISALEAGGCQQVLSCKLRDYSASEDSFKDCLYSFFYGIGNLNWGYTNYFQTRMGGVTRETSQVQSLNDSTVFSFPYILACKYTGKPLIKETVNERKIIYDNVKFQIIEYNEISQNADKLKNKLVLLGTAKEEADMHFTPLGKMSGVEVIAYSILSYTRHGDIESLNQIIILLIALGLCFFAAWMGYVFEMLYPIFFPFLAKIFNFFLMAVITGVAFLTFTFGDLFIELFYPLMGLALTEDVRELYTGIIKWLNKKKRWNEYTKKSLYI